jgi:hypothetical protein
MTEPHEHVKALLRAANAEILRLRARVEELEPVADLATSLIDRQLDDLEELIERHSEGNPNHKGSGPGGGQFTSGPGGGGSGATAHAKAGHGKHYAKRKRRREREKRKPRKPQKTTTSGKKGVDTRVKLTKSDKPRIKDEARAERARATEKRSTAPVQRYAEANEALLIDKIGGTQGTDSGAIDVVRRMGGKEIGIEVKTIVNKGGSKTGSQAQIKCEPDQKARKEGWRDQKPERRELHTVVFDDRHIAKDLDTGEFIGNAEAYSGHQLYYRRGVGPYRIGGMHKVNSFAELKTLMKTPDDQLPAKAKAAEPKKAK